MLTSYQTYNLIFKLKTYNLQITTYKIQIKNYKLQTTNNKLKLTSYNSLHKANIQQQILDYTFSRVPTLKKKEKKEKGNIQEFSRIPSISIFQHIQVSINDLPKLQANKILKNFKFPKHPNIQT